MCTELYYQETILNDKELLFFYPVSWFDDLLIFCSQLVEESVGQLYTSTPQFPCQSHTNQPIELSCQIPASAFNQDKCFAYHT